MSDSLVHETVPLDSLVGQVADEFLRRQERGERPDIAEYVARYPEAAPVLGKVLAALDLLEQSLAGAVAPPDAASDGPVTGVLGDFRIVREVGRGGMGVVYEAEQISLGRRVALKVLPFAAALDAKQLQRFKNEAQAAAHLQHTNIVPVHYVGCERGVHFYAMQFIDGQTLAAVIHDLRRPPSSPGSGQDAGPAAATPPAAALPTEQSTARPAFFRTAAHLGMQAAEALEHAHQCGIVHRDIKPANLLVDAAGRLWVTDFGLAHCQGQPGLTLSGDVLGTLRYMSPEQALAQRVPLDARTDVYSLGVTLYELLTLAPAYPGRNREEVLRQIAFEEPRPPRRLNPAIPADLETVVLKAMAKGPEERYATAQELADDLRHFLEHRPVRARRANLWQWLKKWARRHRAVVVSAGVSAVLLLVVAVAALAVTAVVVSREKQQTDQALAAAQQAQEEQDLVSYYYRIALAERERALNTSPSRVETLLDQCPPKWRGWEWHYLKRLAYAEPLILAGGPHLSFSPDGRRLAASKGREVVAWDAASGQILFTGYGHPETVEWVSFSPDGRRLLSRDRAGSVKLWDLETSQEALVLHGPGERLLDAGFSPDGRFIASVTDHLEAHLCDAATGREIRRLPGQAAVAEFWGKQPHWGLTFSPDGRWLILAGPDQTVRVWEVATGSVSRTLGPHPRRVNCAVFHPDSRHLVTVSGQRWLKAWDLQTGRELWTLYHRLPGVLPVVYSPDGRRLMLGCQENTFRAFDSATGREAVTFRGHGASVFHVAYSPDGRRLASSSGDGTVKLWDPVSGQEAVTLRGRRMGLERVVFSPDGSRIAASCLAEGTVYIWNGAPLGEPEDPRSVLRAETPTEMRAVAFSPDGRRLAATDAAGVLRVWEVPTGRLLYQHQGHSDKTFGLTYSRDGRWLVSAAMDEDVKVWEAESGRLHRTYAGATDWPWDVVFSPDGRRLAATRQKGVHVWEFDSGKTVRTLKHGGPMSHLAYSGDGRYIAAAAQDKRATLWDAHTGEVLKVFPKEDSKFHGAAFSPDSRLLALSCPSGELLLVDVASREVVKTLRAAVSLYQVVFSPDGRYLAGASMRGVVVLWDGVTYRQLEVRRGFPGGVYCVAFSPDSRYLAAASGYEGHGQVKIWPVPPPDATVKAEEQASLR